LKKEEGIEGEAIWSFGKRNSSKKILEISEASLRQGGERFGKKAELIIDCQPPSYERHLAGG